MDVPEMATEAASAKADNSSSNQAPTRDTATIYAPTKKLPIVVTSYAFMISEMSGKLLAPFEFRQPFFEGQTGPRLSPHSFECE
jgi:hypothetical protein